MSLKKRKAVESSLSLVLSHLAGLRGRADALFVERRRARNPDGVAEGVR